MSAAPESRAFAESAGPAAAWVTPRVEGPPAPDPMLPSSYRVSAKTQELADTWTLELEPEAGAIEAYAPGQFGMLYAFGVGEVPISVSSLGADERIVHTVRAVGATTKAICAAEPGDRLGVRGPFGTDWPLAGAEGGDLVLLAGGIGLAPLRPAVEAAIANRDRYGKVSLLYGARSPEELLFTEQFDLWRESGIEVETTVDGAPAGWDGRVGLVTTLIAPAEFDPAKTTALVCGPEVMMRFCAAALEERGVERERIQVSLERNMKCAIGHCGHCQLAHRFVCKDGPVFELERIQTLLGIREL